MLIIFSWIGFFRRKERQLSHIRIGLNRIVRSPSKKKKKQREIKKKGNHNIIKKTNE